ncbi:MAG: UbiA family prenyltransferase [Alphaproteobacteria bacterium]
MLAVDLDNSLIKTDLLYETLVEGLSARPRRTFVALQSLAKGRAALKSALAADSAIDVATLPYNQNVIQTIKDYRASGETVILVSASDQRLVQAVADHLGLFDAAFGSQPSRNLKGARKAQFLVETYGAGQFDYVGDSPADLAVWKQARKAITVGLPPALRASVDALGLPGGAAHLKEPSGRSGRFSDYRRALRPPHWCKNLVVFIPAAADHTVDPSVWATVFCAFVVFCAMASGAYIINDLLDLKADRLHPHNKRRPFADGSLPVMHGLLMAPALVGGGLLLSLAIMPALFLFIVVGYFLLTTLYSFEIKKRLWVDLLVLTLLFLARMLGGTAAAGLDQSWWIIGAATPVFFALACIKRIKEITCYAKHGVTWVPGRAYTVNHRGILVALALAAGVAAVMVVIFYAFSREARDLYNSPDLLTLTGYILGIWIGLQLLRARVQSVHQDTVTFTLRNWLTLVCGAAVGSLLLAADPL